MKLFYFFYLILHATNLKKNGRDYKSPSHYANLTAKVIRIN